MRENHVRLSDREIQLLIEVRQDEFGTDSVPIGEAVEVACKQYLGEQSIGTVNIDDE